MQQTENAIFKLELVRWKLKIDQYISESTAKDLMIHFLVLEFGWMVIKREELDVSYLGI